ncbi:MAG: hypothetical protein ACKV0T_31780 [Planctomycetales bacterium]
MKFPVAKLIATLVCSVSLLGAVVQPTQACCFLDCLFSWCGGCRPACSPCATSYYGPVGCASSGCSTGSCGATTYYSPSWWGGSSSCSSCSPCGVAGSSCASGDCSVNDNLGAPANQDWKKNQKPPKTYGTDGTSGTEGNGTGTESGSGRTDSDPGLDGSNDGDEQDSIRGAGGNRTTRRGAAGTGGGSDIEQVGGQSDGGPSAPIPVKPRKKKEPTPPTIPEDDEEESRSVPRLNLDEKVAWRSAPERKRITLKPHVANARLVRRAEYPKTPVNSDLPVSNVAKK